MNPYAIPRRNKMRGPRFLTAVVAAVIATGGPASAAYAKFDLNPPGAPVSVASHYTPQALSAMGQRGTALVGHLPGPHDSGTTPGGRHTYASNGTRAAHPTAQASAGSGFAWGDAGIGAASMLLLLGAAGVSTVLVRRSRGHHPAAA